MENETPDPKPAPPEQPSSEGLDETICYASLFHPSESDRGFLMWIHERLQHVHCDPDLADYMHKLRAIIAATPADQKTVSAGQGQNSLSELQMELSQHNAELSGGMNVFRYC